MPQTIDIPDVGLVEFPDEMTDRQIEQAAFNVHLRETKGEQLRSELAAEQKPPGLISARGWETSETPVRDIAESSAAAFFPAMQGYDPAQPILPPEILQAAMKATPGQAALRRIAPEFTERMQQSLAGGVASATAPEALPILPAFAVPVVREALMAKMGADATSSAAAKGLVAIQQRDPGLGGEAVGEAALGLSMAIPGVKRLPGEIIRTGGGIELMARKAADRLMGEVELARIRPPPEQASADTAMAATLPGGGGLEEVWRPPMDLRPPAPPGRLLRGVPGIDIPRVSLPGSELRLIGPPQTPIRPQITASLAPRALLGAIPSILPPMDLRPPAPPGRLLRGVPARSIPRVFGSRPEVPATPAQAQVPILQEIRAADARTIRQIQDLFPVVKLTRGQARTLRDLAFPKNQPPPPPPPDQGGGGGAPPPGGPSAIQPSPETPVRPVPPQPGKGPGQVPVQEVPVGVRGRGPQEAAAAAAEVPVEPAVAPVPELSFMDIPESKWTQPGFFASQDPTFRKAFAGAINGRLNLKGSKEVSIRSGDEVVRKHMQTIFDRMRAERAAAKPPPLPPPDEGGAAPVPVQEPPTPPAPAAPAAAAPAPPPVVPVEPVKPVPVAAMADNVKRGVEKAQAVSGYWQGKAGMYRESAGGVEAGGVTGRAIGGSYKEINERRAAKTAKRMDDLGKRAATSGLTKSELTEIDLAYGRIPKALRTVASGRTVKVGSGAAHITRFNNETRELGGDGDILSWIYDHGGILSKSTALKRWSPEKFRLNSSLWDDAPTELAGVHHQIIYKQTALPPDRIAENAFRAGKLKSASVSELWTAIIKASKDRMGGVKVAAREKAFLDSEMKLDTQDRIASGAMTPIDGLGLIHDLTRQQAVMVLKAFESLPEGANPEALQKAYLKLAMPADMPKEAGLGKVAGIKGAREVLDDLREWSKPPPEPKPAVAKLRPGEEQGEVLAQLPQEQQPFNLAGEKGVDWAAREAEAARRAEESAKAKAEQDKLQGDLPGIKIKPKDSGEAGALSLPPAPPALVRAVGNLNRRRKAFGTMFRAGSNRKIMDQRFDGADTEAKIVGQQAARSLQLLGKKADREAAFAIVETGGDQAKLTQFYTQAAGNKTAQSAVRLAARDWARLQPLAAEVKRLLDRQIAEEQTAGIDTEYRDAYVPHMIDRDLLMGAGRPYVIAGRGGSGASTGFKKGRVFDTIFDAIEAGYQPRTMNVADVVQHRVSVGQRLINRKGWADGLRNVVDPTDQAPLVTDLEIRTRGPGGKSYQVAPPGYTPREIIPGVRIAVHEGYATLFDALTGSPRISASVPVQIVLGAEGTIKHGLLAFDSFHASRIAQKQLFLTGEIGYEKGVSLLEYADRDLNRAVQQGLISPEIANWVRSNRATAELLAHNGLNVGRIQEAMYADWMNKVPGIGHFKTWVFEKLTRGAILQSGLIEFERVKRAMPNLTDTQVALKVSRDLNVLFGNLGRQGFFKSQDALALTQAVFLAPQWVESMVRTEAKGFAQMGKGLTYDPIVHKTLLVGTLGKEMAQGLGAYFIATQILNYATRGKPTWQNEEKGHKLDAWIPDWTGKGRGFFISPFSVVAEVTHDVIRYAHTEPSKLAVVSRILGNKLSPIVRAIDILRSGKTFSGQKIVNDWDRAKSAGFALLPVPIPAQAPILGTDFPGQTQRQITASMGLKTEPAPSAQVETLRMADAWLSKQTDPKLKHEFERKQQEEFALSDYTKLRNALYGGDVKTARAEYERLKEVKGGGAKAARTIDETMNPRNADGLWKPIVGPRATEAKFKKSLDAEERKMFEKTRQERLEMYRRFRKMRSAR